MEKQNVKSLNKKKEAFLVFKTIFLISISVIVYSYLFQFSRFVFDYNSIFGIGTYVFVILSIPGLIFVGLNAIGAFDVIEEP